MLQTQLNCSSPAVICRLLSVKTTSGCSHYGKWNKMLKKKNQWSPSRWTTGLFTNASISEADEISSHVFIFYVIKVGKVPQPSALSPALGRKHSLATLTPLCEEPSCSSGWHTFWSLTLLEVAAETRRPCPKINSFESEIWKMVFLSHCTTCQGQSRRVYFTL